jgi:hypothetical protein
MELPPIPDPRHDRIAQAEERLRAAMMRMSQAQELVTLARQRLTMARLALEDTKGRNTGDPPTDVPCRRGTLNAAVSGECFAGQTQTPGGLPPGIDSDRQ